MHISRRDFLKLGVATAAVGILSPRLRVLAGSLSQTGGGENLDGWITQYKPGDWLGRVLGDLSNAPPLHSRPDSDSPIVGKKKPEDIVTILREVVGSGPRLDPHNHRWFETAEGFLWAPYVIPMEFHPNSPQESLPNGKAWGTITVPWLEGRSEPSDSASMMMLPGDRPTRLYYASNFPVTKVVKDDKNRIWYFLDELSLPMYVHAEGLHLITPEELSPLSPNVENKKIVVDLQKQTLSAQENGVEVFYTVIASGPFLKSENRWTTPPGEHPIWRKRIGMRMSFGTNEYGYDEPGVGWTSLFVGTGVAIHSTYWHNDFGIPKSHGCVNARPADALWLFRWTQPAVTLPAGDVQVQMPGGTRVVVLD